jgi:acetyl esterase/lipase
MNPTRIERLDPSGEVRWTLFPFPCASSTGQSVLILPGGGYGFLAVDHEGEQIARWLNARGFDAWVLHYSVVGDNLAPPLGFAPLEDALTALAHIRKGEVIGLRRLPGSHVHGIGPVGAKPPASVGVWGFSAGGHLAAMLATHPEAELDFTVLAYPVISMESGVTHGGSRRNLLGEHPDAHLEREFSAQLRVSPQTPPTFLFHTANDEAVPVQNSLLFASALAQHGVPFEILVLPDGPHGIGLSLDDPKLNWSGELERWLQGFAGA